MKKIILTSLIAGFAAVSAYASDGGLYRETYTTTNRVSAQYDTDTYYAAPQYAYAQQQYAPAAQRPCAQAADPIAVKTHTEVIDHYQVYQPVTVYQPAGTFAQRRIVDAQPAAAPCSRCGY